MMRYMWPGMMGGWGYRVGGFLPMALFLIVVVLAVFLLAKSWGKPPTKASSQENNAMEVLKIRYAKGEITKKEFEEMKKDLN